MYQFAISALILGSLVRSAPPQLKIIGGNAARTASDFPYQVSLRYRNFHFCGGAIIAESYVLTAAHCCFDEGSKPWSMRELKVMAGQVELAPSRRAQIRTVSRVHVHPLYDPERVANDIALWKVATPFELTNNVRPVDLARSQIADRTICNVSGWGVSDYKKSLSEKHLRYVEVPIVSNKKCRKDYPEIDDMNVICAGQRGKDSCQGDSGGALVCNGRLTGVVSYGIECGVLPGVYTNVYRYQSWINKTINSSKHHKTSFQKILGLMSFVFMTQFHLN